MNPLKKLKDSPLLSNMALLSVLQFSTLLLGLITTSYQSHLLGKDLGYLAYVQVYMTIFQLFIDFGFALSATGKVAKHRDDKSYLGRLLSSVILIKLTFIAISALALIVLLRAQNPQPLEVLTYWLYFLSVGLMAMLPDFLYRGIEKMAPITIRAVSVKVFSTLMIFVFMRNKTDYYMTPLFTSIGNFVAMFLVYRHLKGKIGIWFLPVKWKDIWQEAKDSFQFFASRIATTIYGSVNGLILGRIDPTVNHESVIFYNKANEVVNAARVGLIGPVADSIYPHMMRHKNFSVIKKALKISMPIMLLGCAGVFFLSDWICLLWLGAENGPQSAAALRALLPMVVISLPSYILGFPTLSPIGLSKYANSSINIGTIFHIAGLAVLYLTGHLTLIPICLLTCCTEFLIFAYRVFIVYKNRHLLRPDAALSEEEKQELAKENILLEAEKLVGEDILELDEVLAPAALEEELARGVRPRDTGVQSGKRKRENERKKP